MERTCIDVDAFEVALKIRENVASTSSFNEIELSTQREMVVRLITNYTIAIVERVKATSIKL